MNALLPLSGLIDRINDRIGQLIRWLVLAAVLISAGNAIVRKAFNISSNAFLEMQWYLFAAVFMLGAGYAFLRNVHVRIDFISSKLSKRTNAIIDVARHRGLPDPAVPDPDHAELAVLRQRLEQRRDVAERRRPDPLAGLPADPGGLQHPAGCRASPS